MEGGKECSGKQNVSKCKRRRRRVCRMYEPQATTTQWLWCRWWWRWWWCRWGRYAFQGKKKKKKKYQRKSKPGSTREKNILVSLPQKRLPLPHPPSYSFCTSPSRSLIIRSEREEKRNNWIQAIFDLSRWLICLFTPVIIIPLKILFERRQTVCPLHFKRISFLLWSVALFCSFACLWIQERELQKCLSLTSLGHLSFSLLLSMILSEWNVRINSKSWKALFRAKKSRMKKRQAKN